MIRGRVGIVRGGRLGGRVDGRTDGHTEGWVDRLTDVSESSRESDEVKVNRNRRIWCFS